MNKLNQINERVGKYRWTICALLFFATTVNYLDRQVLSLLKDKLEVEFNWTDTDYANIVMVFQFVYAVSMLFAGRIIDWLGTKSGYAWSLVIWSVGALLHAIARGTGGFMFARAVLGFGEAGNFPAAIKTTAEWFPKKERALATGIFNSGTNVGAILAPITVPWLADQWGWQGAFIIVGAIGFLWLIFWFWLYERPSKQKRLGKAEYDYIHSDMDEQLVAAAAARRQRAQASVVRPVVQAARLPTDVGVRLRQVHDRWRLVVLPLLAPGLPEGAVRHDGDPSLDSDRRSVHDDLRRQHRWRMVPDVLHQQGL